jgi:hypothetical protein
MKAVAAIFVLLLVLAGGIYLFGPKIPFSGNLAQKSCKCDCTAVGESTGQLLCRIDQNGSCNSLYFPGDDTGSGCSVYNGETCLGKSLLGTLTDCRF